MTLPLLPAGWLGHQQVRLAQCGSTNDEALALARSGAAAGTLVIADAQVGGRGRLGRNWASPPGNLYVSCILRPNVAPQTVPMLALAIGVAIVDALRAFTPLAPVLKWPNDVLVGTQKLSGILLEAQSQANQITAVVAGIGINIVAAPPGHPRPAHATALADHGIRTNRDEVLAMVLPHLARWHDVLCRDGAAAIAAAWRTRMAPQLPVQVQVGESLVAGVAETITDTGALCVRTVNGVITVTAGEVEIVRTFESAS